MLASLPMYDRTELREAHQEYWRNIQNALSARGIDSSNQLESDGIGLSFWSSEDLLLSQTCGMPYRKYLHERVNLVGTPDYAVESCPAGYYCSHFVVRKNDVRNVITDFQSSVFAYNETESQSGFAAPWNHLKPNNIWFDRSLQTGTHLKSAEAVANGKADIASIDAVTWRFAERYEALAGCLRILATTKPTPGLPYITSKRNNPDLIFSAVVEGIDQTTPDTLKKIGIQSIVRLPKDDYLKIPNPYVSDHVTN